MAFPTKGSLPLLAFGFLSISGTTLRAVDCNDNGIDDALDILPQNFGFLVVTPGYPVGQTPVSLIARDLNGDGKPDLATANLNSGNFSVLLNQGDGNLQQAASYRTGSRGHPFSLLSADLNGDGKLELAAANAGSNAVSVLLNQGDGTFGSALSYSVENMSTFSRGPLLVAADLNGDGKVDLSAANSGCLPCNPPIPGDTLSVLLNTGDGTFEAAVSYSVGMAPLSLISADLNHDGKPDLATANTGCLGCEPPGVDVSVLLNKGDGTFQAALSYPVGTAPLSLITADLNGDGIPDLATANLNSGDVSVLLNQADGTFKNAVSYPVGEGPLFLIADDLSQDEIPDLAIATFASVSILLNRGDGTFTAAVEYRFENGPDYLVAADIDGDGKSDLATATAQNVVVLLNLGGGNFKVADSFPVGLGSLPRPIVAADLNGDGGPDLSTANGGPNNVSVLLNQTTPPFSLDVHQNGIPDECETQFHRGDPNSDGTTNISDGLAIFDFLFLGGTAPRCRESADVNNNGSIDITDGVYLLNWLFLGGPEPAAPGPTTAPCGLDPDPPASPADLGCEAYGHCN
jgi:hypothetical protein